MKSISILSVVLAATVAAVADRPVTPPGPLQAIVAPQLPTPAPPVVLNGDSSGSPEFAIVASRDDCDVVTIPVGRLLMLGIVGVSTTATTTGPVPAVGWSMNVDTPNIAVGPNGHAVYFSAETPGTYLFTACVNNPDATAAPLTASKWVVVTATQPMVDPVKPLKPDGKSPFAEPGLHCLILYESDALQNLPTAQQDAINSTAVRTYLDTHCVREADGTPSYRIWDDDVDARNDLPLWQKALASAPRDNGPYIAVGGERGGYVGKLPGDEAALLDLLKKYGGD